MFRKSAIGKLSRRRAHRLSDLHGHELRISHSRAIQGADRRKARRHGERRRRRVHFHSFTAATYREAAEMAEAALRGRSTEAAAPHSRRRRKWRCRFRFPRPIAPEDQRHRADQSGDGDPLRPRRRLDLEPDAVRAAGHRIEDSWVRRARGAEPGPHARAECLVFAGTVVWCSWCWPRWR